MPDWFYRTVTRPVLFRLPARTARGLALGFMGRLARLPLGPAVIDFLGHMRPDPRLQRSFRGIDFPTAVGLGPGLDGAATALPALARFGVGFLEVGPVTVTAVNPAQPLARRPDQEAVWFPDPPECLGVRTVLPRLAEAFRLGLPLILRLGHTPGAGPESTTAECLQLVHELVPHVHLFSLTTLRPALADGWSSDQWCAHLHAVVAAAQQSPPRPVLLCVPADLDPDKAEPLLTAALAAGVGGLLVDGSVPADSGRRLLGLPAREPALECVRRLRRRHGDGVLLIGSGGVHEPEHALELRAAGADLVQVDSGLVYSGPGLPKRINDAFLFEATRNVRPADRPERAPEMTWFWTALMGAGMLFGSVLALLIAMTLVVLPYDLAFMGMKSRDELTAINPRLLAFMAHDRVSLAGTMVAIGVLYVGLSLFGIRRGLHWARQAVFVSAFTGFASFFLFLGFGYLDPFHAFVTAVLFQLLLLAVHCRLGTYHPTVAPALREDRAWRRSLWGQLLLIVHGCALLAAGAAISTVGVTRVFVPEDLEFMRTTAEALRAADPRLVPLVAHDRATFGGMLLASGWVFLLPALWGFRNGSAWLWRTLLVAGLTAYTAAIGVHFVVGYTNPMHLLPAFAGLALFLLGLGLSHEYLCGAPRTSARPLAPETRVAGPAGTLSPGP
jgi:dihydroorotate dehydrogenase